jgi:hypothetical protein
MLAPFRKPQPSSREPEHPPSPQAVGECGRDENLEKGAAHQLQMATQARVCFRKILQRDFLTCRTLRSTRSDSSKPSAESQKTSKKSSFTKRIAL